MNETYIIATTIFIDVLIVLPALALWLMYLLDSWWNGLS